MTTIRESSVVILEFGGEGGGYTLMGKQQAGKWVFFRGDGDGDSWLYELEEGLPNAANADDPIKDGPWRAPDLYDGLEDALDAIKSSWPFLTPIRVHPEFIEQLQVIALAQLSAAGQSMGKSRSEIRWKKLRPGAGLDG